MLDRSSSGPADRQRRADIRKKSEQNICDKLLLLALFQHSARGLDVHILVLPGVGALFGSSYKMIAVLPAHFFPFPTLWAAAHIQPRALIPSATRLNMLCTQCNTDNTATNRFCGNCGAKLEVAPAAQEGPPAVPEARSGSAGRPIDLRDPTDPGHMIVPANGRNMTHAPAEEPLSDTSAEEAVPVIAEADAHEVGPKLQDAVAYRADQSIAAEPADKLGMQEPSHGDELQPARRARRDTSIHGPSLLGLSDDDSSDTSSDGDTGPTDYSYLYEDEGTRRGVNWRLMLALVILIGFGGVLAYMWSQGKNWNTTIVKSITGGSNQPKQAPVVAKTEPTTPGAPEIAVGQTQKPIPADTPQSDKDANGSSTNKSAEATNTPSDQQAAKSSDKNSPADNAKAAESAAQSKKGSAGDNAGATDAAAVAAKDKSAKDADAKDKNATGAADDRNSKQAMATTPDIGDEEDAEPSAPKSGNAKGKASAAKSSSADDEQDDTALVHRGDALLKSRNCNEAVDLFREAALHGNATARSRLGGLYATGHCVPLDRAEAYNWFTLAKDAGAHYSWIDHNRNMLWAQMTDRERERVMRK